MPTVRRVVLASFDCPTAPNTGRLYTDRTSPRVDCFGGDSTRDDATNNRQNGMLNNDTGSFGDGGGNFDLGLTN